MNYNEFINEYNGKSFDYDGVSGVQCVDLIKMYLNKVFEIEPGAWGNAKDYYENYDNLSVIKSNFDRIANSNSFIPQDGDIVIWGEQLGGGYGHMAIATGEGDTSNFYSYDLNWNSKIVEKVEHDYKGFLGVLRAKNQNKIIGENSKSIIQYKVHIQDIGWTDWKNSNEIVGTVGEEKRIEAIILQGNNGLDLSYRVHMENIGWGEWKSGGEVAGTTGESRRIEAIEIKSSKILQVEEHVQEIGWLPSSKGKEIRIGTQGKSLRLEAFKISVI